MNIFGHIGGVYFSYKIFTLLFYLINGLGFYKLAKIRGIQYPWLAFIPVFNLYIVGVVGDSLKYRNYTISKYFNKYPLALVLPLGFAVFNMFAYGRLFLWIGQLAVLALQLMIFYLVYEYYDDKNKILFTVLSIIPIMPPILILYVTRKIKI